MRFPRRPSESPVEVDALERVGRRLRRDDPFDPPYEPGRFAQLVSTGGVPEGRSERWLAGSRVRSPILGGLGVGSFALVVVLVIGVVAIRLSDGGRVGQSPPQAASDLLAEVRESGQLRVAIRPDFPQATTDKLAGFDVDVASALATRLGVRLEIVVVDAADMATSAATDDWDLAMPSSSQVSTAASLTPTDAYYAFPSFVVVSDGSAAQTPADLGGTRICVVRGSAGEAWIAGRFEGAIGAPPPGTTGRVEAGDQMCLDDLATGEVDAVVTSTLTAADIAVRPSVRILGQPVLLDRRSMVAQAAGPDPSTFLGAVDAALGQMRTDGTLSDLSRNRFGGQDLTAP
jgi:ABC-type amino acid transport substrate-binding protein